MASDPATTPNTARDPAIDLLRALLFVYVVGYLHLGGYVADGNTHVHWSTVAVTNLVLGTFTFVSGFMLSEWRAHDSGSGVWRFYKRRFLRVYPLYLLALAGFVLIWLADLETAIKAAFAVSMFWPEPPMTLWFITMIIVCYLLAPALIAPGRPQALVIAIAIWLSMLLYNFSVTEIDPRMLTQFAAFAAGVFCGRFNSRSRLRTTPLTLLVFFASMGLAVLTLQWPLLGAIGAIPSVIVGPMILLHAAERIPHSISAHPAVAFLSYIGFSAYLFHRIVFELVKRSYWPSSEISQWALLIFVALPLIAASAWMVQYSYDHMLRKSRLA